MDVVEGARTGTGGGLRNRLIRAAGGWVDDAEKGRGASKSVRVLVNEQEKRKSRRNPRWIALEVTGPEAVEQA